MSLHEGIRPTCSSGRPDVAREASREEDTLPRGECRAKAKPKKEVSGACLLRDCHADGSEGVLLRRGSAQLSGVCAEGREPSIQ